MATSTGQMTVEQYLALPEQCDTNGNDVKSELIAGEIVLAPLPSLRHDLLKNQICDVLRSFLGERPDLGLRAFVQMGFAVTEVDALIPDVCVIAKSRLQETTSKVLTGAQRSRSRSSRPATRYFTSGAKSILIYRMVRVRFGLCTPKSDPSRSTQRMARANSRASRSSRTRRFPASRIRSPASSKKHSLPLRRERW